MKHEFLKFYKQIISEAQESQENSTNEPMTMTKRFDNAKTDAINSSICTQEIGNAAFQDINSAYIKSNETLFDKVQQKKKQKKTTDTIATTSKADTAKADTSKTDTSKKVNNNTGSTQVSTDSNGVKYIKTSGRTTIKSDAEGNSTIIDKDGKVTKHDAEGNIIKQSIKLSNKFNQFYNLVFQDEQIIKEGKTQDVQSENYILVVNDDGTFKLQNLQDLDTKFTIEDYKNVNKWLVANHEPWMACVKKFGGGSAGIKDEDIDSAISNFKDIKDVQKTKDVINKIKQFVHFRDFTKLISTMKKKEGYLDDDTKKDIKQKYLAALIYIINQTYADAPDAAQRKVNKAQKEKQNKEKIKRNKPINANQIMQVSQDKDPDLKARKQKLYKSFIQGSDTSAAAFKSIANDLSLNDILCQGTGDADDEQLQWSQNSKNDAWQNCDNYKDLPNDFVQFLYTATNFDNLQTKITAIAYMSAVIQAKGTAGQYTDSDFKAKKDVIEKFISEVKQLFDGNTNGVGTIKANWNFNFNFENKNTIQQILELSGGKK